MSTSIKISLLNNYPTIARADFIPIVESASLTTYRTPVTSIGDYIAVSGSVISSSWSSASISSSNAVTSSYAVEASHAVSASYAITASYVASSSYAITSSYSFLSATASYFNFSVSPQISCSWASRSISSSHALMADNAAVAVSSSFAITASYAATTPSSATGFTSGMVMMFAMQTPPSGWLECNGAVVLISSYVALDAAIWVGAGLNGSSHWGYRSTDSGGVTRNNAGGYLKLPDMRGLFARGWANAGSIDSGRAWASYQDDAVISHTHAYNFDSFIASIFMGTTVGGISYPGGSTQTGVPSVTTAAETRPKNQVFMYCIKT